MSIAYSMDAQTERLANPLPDMVNPPASWLAQVLEGRLAAENAPTHGVALPQGVRADLRPKLPKVSMAAMMLFTHRRHVDSFPLLFTTLALAHPN